MAHLLSLAGMALLSSAASTPLSIAAMATPYLCEGSDSHGVCSHVMTEAPFVPRERLFKQQQYFQSLTKHTFLKGRYDVITSVAIPLALAGTSLFMIGRGVYNMSHGIGKKE
ncbi:hypothetical protein ABZP36_000315 [Zizania latifolia]